MPRIIGMLLLLPLLVGCGDSNAVVTGKVTYQGKAVENGFIQFQPVGGTGSSSGGPITNGRYGVKTVPGKKMVQVMASQLTAYERPSPEEEARLLREARARGDNSGIIRQAGTIPPNAEGNNVEVEIKQGSQTFNFDLK